MHLARGRTVLPARSKTRDHGDLQIYYLVLLPASYGNGRLVALLVWGDANTSGIGVLLARDDAYAELVQLVKLGRVRVSYRRLRAMVMSA